MAKIINPLRLLIGGILCLLLGVFVLQATSLNFTQVAYRSSKAADWVITTHPIILPDEDTFLVNLSFTKRNWHPSTLQLIADDCVEDLFINGRTVDSVELPFCDYTAGRFLDLTDYLKPGNNELYATVKNLHGAGNVRLQLPPWAGAYSLARLLIIIGLLAASAGVFLSYASTLRHKVIATLFVFGASLRLLYTAFTTYYQRGHDVTGHIQYIAHFTESLKVPEASAGWLFYHPPLYYWLNASVWRFTSWWQLTDWQVYQLLQGVSLLIGLATLAVAFWIGCLLFRRQEQTTHLIVYGLLISIVPSFIFLSARINNDTLVQFFMFLSCALLLKWWQANNHRFWYLALGSIALGILTKTNAILMLPVAFGLLGLNRGLSRSVKKRLAIMGGVLLIIMTGWFFALRFGLEGNDSLVQNASSLVGSDIEVRNDLKTLTTFNPVAIVQTPFNNPWDDGARRQFFWEYLWRSAFFGEFRFDKLRTLASLIMLFSVLLIPFVIKGLWQSIKTHWYELLPILLTFGFLTVGHVAIRQKEAFACTQDFRYSILLIVPMAVFLVMGMQNKHKNNLRNTPMYLCLALILSCTALLGGIAWAYS